MTRRPENAKSSSPTLAARLSAREAAPPWPLASAAVTVAGAFALVVIGALAGASLLGESALPLYGWTIGAALAALMVWQTRASQRQALALGPGNTPLALVLFLSIGAAVGIDVIGLAVTGEFMAALPLSPLVGRALGLGEAVLALAFMAAALPLADELVFRAVLLPSLRAAFGGWAGLIGTALLGGLFTFLAFTPAAAFSGGASLALYWYGLAAPALAGLWLGGVRVATGSTRAAIAAHAVFGLFAVLKLWAIAT